MAANTPDKSNRIISLIRGALHVDVVAQLDGKVKSLRFLKNHSDDEIRDIVLGKHTPEDVPPENTPPAEPSAGADNQPTVPPPENTPKNRVSRQDMIEALKKAGVTDFQANNREALEKAYFALVGGDK